MRLYLHIRLPDGTVLLDPDGQEFDSQAAARAEAEASARELMADALRAGESLRVDRVFEVADEDGQVQLRVTFRSALVL